MSSANRHGWEILMPHDVEIIWDGISDSSSEHVKILKGESFTSGQRFAHTGTGNSTITFCLNALLETDDNHYSLLSGSPNYFLDGVKPMNGLIRSDWYHFNPIEFSWKVTTPNKKIVFEKDQPFLFLTNYPKNLINKTDFIVTKATSEEVERMSQYGKDRQKFYEDHKKWTHWYRDGIEGNSGNSFAGAEKIIPQEPRYIK